MFAVPLTLDQHRRNTETADPANQIEPLRISLQVLQDDPVQRHLLLGPGVHRESPSLLPHHAFLFFRIEVEAGDSIPADDSVYQLRIVERE
ncbi:hypothetical protein D3C71_2032990 [compost metagenome]